MNITDPENVNECIEIKERYEHRLSSKNVIRSVELSLVLQATTSAALRRY